METARVIPTQWESQHPLNFLQFHQARLSLHEIRASQLIVVLQVGEPLPGMLQSDPWAAGLDWLASEFFSKDFTGNTNVEWSMLKWLIKMETIFNFEAVRLWKFYSCPIWREKEKPCKLISTWVEICEARTQNSKGFVSSFFCCYCSIWVCWWVLWSWTHTAPARE